MTLATGFLLPIFWVLSSLGFLGNPSPASYHLTSLPNSSTLLWNQLTKSESLPPSLPVLELALNGYAQLQDKLKKPLLTVIDYSLPSTQKRLWIIDLAQQKILLHTVVGINDQARARAIVIHGADYAKETVAATAGRLGRSLGCPAVPPDLSTPLIKLIKEGSLLFIYGKDPNYLRMSKFWSPPLPAQ